MPLRLRRILPVLACLILDLPWQLHALDGIYIKPVNHTGPMIEGSKYELQCEIVNVASIESLTVKWYKREKEVHNETFNDIIKTPVTKTSKLQITPNKADNGTQYRCEAERNVSPLTSEPLTIEVHYKPVINETKLPSLVPVFRGYHVVLFCEAKGNPTPEISWKTNPNNLVNGEILIITEATSQNPVCIANNSVGTVRREVRVDLTGIYIKPVNHTGPMIEGSKYELQCDIVNVASVESLTVKWYKREKEVHNETFNDIIKTPVTKTSKLQITPNKADNGTQYRCEAKLNVEPVAQNVSPLTSESLTIEVHYKPVINKTKLPSDVPIFRGYPVVLSCEAEGNPPPDISWTINRNVPVKGGILNITEAASKKIVCIANNSVGTDTRKVNVDLKEDYLPLIAGLVAITVAVISVIFIFIYSIYYKTAKMGHYSLKDTKPCVQNGNIAQNGKDNTIPMKKLSQSDILA